MTYVPSGGTSLYADFKKTYSPPLGTSIYADLDPPPEEIVFRGVNPGTSIPWGKNDTADSGKSAGWTARRHVSTNFSGAWGDIRKKDACVASAWESTAQKDRNLSFASRTIHEKSASSRVSWNSGKYRDRENEIKFKKFKYIIDEIKNIVFRSPPAMDGTKRIGWNTSIIQDVQKKSPWKNPPVKDRTHRTLWGPKYYLEICFRKYTPPGGTAIVIDFADASLVSHTPDGTHITAFFDELTYDRRCTWREHSGWRDAYYHIRPATIPSGIWRSIYSMLNTAYLTRLPDRAPVQITSMTISSDWDSNYWTLQAAVGDDASLALVDPTDDGPISVEAAINGHLWKLQVERWNTGHGFARTSRSISGRSISAQLGAPMADLRTNTITEQRTALQLANIELENTGWTVTFAIDDWIVPANVMTYQDQTPMQIIRKIAECCRAIVETDKTAQTIIVRPRYKVKPWLLASATPDLVIPAAMAARIDGDWDERPSYNSVFVSGENSGISATITREGSAGDLIAPMITDKLITAVEPARALGIAVIGGSGKWSKHRIELPVFRDPEVPGIITPGMIIEYNLGQSSWKGFVSAVSVSVQRNRDGLKVRQTIDVERYRGN